jgi:hypothetical protein
LDIHYKTVSKALSGIEKKRYFNGLLPKGYPFEQPLKAFWLIKLGEA